MATAAADLLAIDAASLGTSVGAAVVDAEKAYIESLPDESLFDAAATAQAELAKAKAALARKQATAGLTSTKGPIVCFEGTPIDCGAVADAAVAGYINSLTTSELEAMAKETEANLVAAKAARDKKRAAAAAAPAAPAAPASPAVPTAPATAAASKLSGEPRSPVSPLARTLGPVVQAVSPVVDKASALLDDASTRTGVSKSALAASVVAGAAAGAALMLGALFKKR